ncbi:uncharacterized protein [Blastocystis hominis]|uniref:Uncharacterized protein n=1 Tax=Blastocystis hominis TaxID=12968 RepID=D8M8S7_BLAHO|nr:uncharacterized protein [Blastocystis hominis]CBK24466.2 unnamed protein product [Blastocystis hominis]|eukprot:XP_012898514.1 uncharacterized protein [Blastocystis hominis]
MSQNIQNGKQTGSGANTSGVDSSEILCREFERLWNFIDHSLECYTAELFDFFSTALEKSILYLAKDRREDAYRLFKKFQSLFYLPHEGRYYEIVNLLSSDKRSGDRQIQYMQKLITMHKMTYIVLHSFLNEVPCHTILDIENKFIRYDIVDTPIEIKKIPYYEFQNELSTPLPTSQSSLSLLVPPNALLPPRNPLLPPSPSSTSLSPTLSPNSTPTSSESASVPTAPTFSSFFLSPIQIACTTENGFFHLWSCAPSASQPTHHLLLGHADVVTDFDFSRDSLYLLSCALDGSIKLWSTELHRCLVNYRSFSVPLWHIRFYPENSCFACIGGRGMIYNYNTSDVQMVNRILPRMTIVTALLLLSDTTIIGYRNGDRIAVNGFGNAVTSLSLVQNGAFIAVGYVDGLFRVVDLEGRAVIRPQRAHSKAIRRILWKKDRELILTFGEDGAIRVWRLEEIARVVKDGEETFQHYSFQENREMIEPKVEFTMNLVKTYTVEGMELLEAVEVKRGWILVAGTMKEALCVCWKK